MATAAKKAPAKRAAKTEAAEEAVEKKPAAEAGKGGKGGTTALVKWDEALAARAAVQKKVAAAASGGGAFISFKGGGISFKGSPVEDDVLDVVVLDSVMENQLYDGAYDENNPQAPLCYAFGRDLETMAPHPDVVEAGNAQADRCKDCPHNQWNTAEKGRGKACKNVFRLAIIPAEDAETPEKVAEAELVFAKTPVTSGKNWGNYVRSLEALKLPPLAFITTLGVVPSKGTQFQVTFKAEEKIEDGDVIGALLEKAEQAEAQIDFPYPKFEEAGATPQRKAAPPPVKRAGVAAPRGAPAKKVAVKRAGSKY